MDHPLDIHTQYVFMYSLIHGLQAYLRTRFYVVRLAGGILVILFENNPKSNGLLIATLILLNVGVFPCIAATIGLINIM